MFIKRKILEITKHQYLALYDYFQLYTVPDGKFILYYDNQCSLLHNGLE
jgi:hypothetical protein